MAPRLNGLPAAPGIGIGTLAIYRPVMEPVPARPDHGSSPGAEWEAFQSACRRLDAELEAQSHNENTLVGELFSAHRVILQDRMLLEAVQRRIFDEGESAWEATRQVMKELTELFRSFEDEYFAGRAVDILDLGRRLMFMLSNGNVESPLHALSPQAILLACDLTPSELTMLPLGHVQGIALAYSTPTAHSAILAHSLGIPMVSTLGPEIMDLEAGAQAVVDGTVGRLVVEPAPEELNEYRARRTRLQDARIAADVYAHDRAITHDGVYVPVFANANRPIDVARATETGADGIGLLRTEYLFLERSVAPTVEEQTAVYLSFAREVRGPLVVRALDAGGDKPVGFVDHAAEDNPFLGLRGIRLLLKQPDLLRVQYHALRNAAAAVQALEPPAVAAEFRFLLPMISTVEELHSVRRLLAEGNGDQPSLPLGAMIEVPSAALIAGAIAPLVDFLSIGTNDLAQYALASDRTNSAVARLADPLHPAVLQLIHAACRAGQAHKRPVAVCGEIAGNPLATPLLLGLGVTELSAPLPDVAQVKEAIRRVSLAHCRELAAAALACSTGAEVRDLLVAFGK